MSIPMKSAMVSLLLLPLTVAAEPNVDLAVAFLKQTQNEDGSWGDREIVGVTGLVLTAMVDSGVAADDSSLTEGFAFLRSNARESGGIHPEDSLHRNYDTALSLVAFQKLGLTGDEGIRQRAIAFLKGLQWDEGEGLNPNDVAYGGAGYGSKSRPDLSNTQVLIDALKQSGLTADDPVMQKALVFISRTQNLESEHNATIFAGLVNDGGFYYTPAAGGSSQAGQTENGGLRSYASMTYAGLKSLVYAGLSKDDPRVKAATDWIRKHYTLEENPGLKQQGLFYYYLTFAKTMDALESETFVDAAGESHDWAAELRDVLAAKQNTDGSWSNPADRWMEGDKRLVTAYALIALGNLP